MIEDNSYPSGKINKKRFIKRSISEEKEIAPFGYKRYKVYKDGIMYYNREGEWYGRSIWERYKTMGMWFLW